MSNSETCTLCQNALPKNAILDHSHAFCCSGCFAVFQILSTKEVKENFKEHPLFQEAVRSKIISNPRLQEELNEKEVPGEIEKFHFEIEEMWCASCSEAIRLILMRKKGIKKCLIDYATDLALVEFSPKLISKETIFKIIENLGYLPKFPFSKEKKKGEWVRFAVCLFCTLNLMMFAYPLYISHFKVTTEGYDRAMGWFSFCLSLPLVSYGSLAIWKRFFLSIKTGLFGMETLILMGVLSSFCFSTFHLFCSHYDHLYYDSMGMVLTFTLLGKLLEKKAKFSMKESLFRITRKLPKRACKKMPSGEFHYVPVKEVAKGDILLARMGEKIALDGVVEKGEALVDESLITGEAAPKQKKEKSTLVSGSIIKKGFLQYSATSIFESSLLSQIFQTVEKDLQKKSSFHRITDRLTLFVIPALLLISSLLFLNGYVLRALSVLLISCPCAIGIAIPLVESFLLKIFAEKGAMVRNRRLFLLLAKEPLFAFDKTGTLTEGRFTVLKGFETLSFDEKSILKTLTAHSTHPISVAICESLLSPHIEMAKIEEIVGRGLKANLEGICYLLGSETFMKENQIETTSFSQSVVYFAKERKILAEIFLGDRLRENLPKIEGVVLSGDSMKLTAEVAQKCGFRFGKGGLNPLQKKLEIEALKKEKRVVAMVGDGVNDAAALASADIGISISSGSDISIEVSDLYLASDRLEILPELVRLSKWGQKVMKQNLFWAFIYNVVGIFLAIFGLMTPLFSAIAMTLSSLFVMANSYRILWRARVKM